METYVKTLISLVCVGGVAYLAYKNRSKILNLIVEQQNDDRHPQNEEPIDCNVAKALFPKESFIANVSKFSGSFEPLYTTVNNTETPTEEKVSILQDWSLRFMAASCSKEYKAWLDGMGGGDTSKLERLLEEIFKSGIVRDDKAAFVVDDISAKNYIEWTGAELRNGDHVKVGSAAWTLNGICIEKGIVSKI